MRKDLEFYNLIGFYSNKEFFRNNYKHLNEEEKKIYKMYVYSLPFMEDDVKDLIWEYLNGYEESQFDLGKKYRKAKEKFNKRKKDMEGYIENVDEFN